jgi:geranylgeranyl pyrophosphate synthase
MNATKTHVHLVSLLEPIRPDMERVKSLLHETMAQVEEPLRSMLHRSLTGGKRLRSALVILVGQMLESPIVPFYRLAAGVDMLHAATLVHDDLVDDSPRRRGQQALHTVWPTGATVLAGDYLMARSASLIADLGDPKLLKVFTEALCTICSGEIKQMMITRGRHRHAQDYYRGIEAKTASLFAAATEMAGLLAGGTEVHVTALRRFGREFGMAFQIMDDILDFVGDEARLGKPAGSDLRQGLVTLPVLIYLERAQDTTPVHAVLSGQRDEEHIRAAVEAVSASGAIDAAVSEARSFVGRSQGALMALPDNAARNTLYDLAAYVVQRRR